MTVLSRFPAIDDRGGGGGGGSGEAAAPVRPRPDQPFFGTANGTGNNAPDMVSNWEGCWKKGDGDGDGVRELGYAKRLRSPEGLCSRKLPETMFHKMKSYVIMLKVNVSMISIQ